MELLAALLFALAAFVASRAVLARAPSITRSRLDAIAHAGTVRDEAAPDVSQRMLRPLVDGLRRGFGALLPDHIGEWLEHEIDSAGIEMTPGAFIVLNVAAPTVLGGFVALSVNSSTSVPAGFGTLLILAAVALGLVGPTVWLKGRVARRIEMIQKQLPDTLDLIVVSVEAGLGFEAAVQRITEQADGPLSEELRHVLADMNLGISRREAMQTMAQRSRAPGVQSLVTAILQAERTGMGIGGVLRSQATHVRTMRRQRAEEAAMKAPLKMLFPLLFFIFPSLFIVILGAPVLNLLRTLGGN